MKMLILSFTLLSLGGSAGWLLKSGTESSPNRRNVSLSASHTSTSQAPSTSATRVSLEQILTTASNSKERPLIVNGDELFGERFCSATVWVRSINKDGGVGTKHAFVEAREQPPLSGKYSPIRYTFLNRPDLQGLLQEDVREGAEVDRVLLARLEIYGSESNEVVALRVFVPNAQSQNPPRVITVMEDSFPITEEGLWRLVLQRLQSAKIRTT